MKKLLLSLLFFFIGYWAYSQSGSITLSQDSLCAGQSLTATVHPPAYSHSGATGTNNQNGIMFDITALESCIIQNFIINNITANTTYEVYSRIGSHVGHENNAASWTLVGTSSNLPAGPSVDLDLNFNLPVIIGQTRAFYITSNNPNNMITYGNGTLVGSISSSSSYFQLKTGVGKSYPFGSSFNAREFIGSVIYSPVIESVLWNTGDTTASITITPGKSLVLSATMQLSGNGPTVNYRRAVIVMDLQANASADPPMIQPGGSSMLSGTVTLKRGVATTMAGGNSQHGAMFNVLASSTLKIEGFTINHSNVAGSVEILYKTGTLEGFEANASAWTSLGLYSQIASVTGEYLPLATPVIVAAGQTVAFYITSTTGQVLSYTNGNGIGQTAATGPGIVVKEGKGIVYPFGISFSPRVLNAIVHYELINPPGSVYQWSSGGSGGSVLVSPGITTTYTLQTTNSGCQGSDTAVVTVSGIGINELEPKDFLVYPNPATDLLTIETPFGDGNIEYTFFDLNGRLVTSSLIDGDDGKVSIPVKDLPAGIYILKVKHGQHETASRVHIIR